MNVENILSDINNSKFAPIYLLQGEETYFIDQVTNALLNKVIPDDQKDLNQIILYGLDTDVSNIISICRNYPMVGDKLLVVVKEAQQLRQIESLISYVNSHMPSTILVLSFKNKTLDKRGRLENKIKSIGGIVLTSDKIDDRKLTSYVKQLVKSAELNIGEKAVVMLSEYLGSDLAKLSNEIEKLKTALSNNENKEITPDLIELNIGISKDYNVFEITDAVSEKNLPKAIKIADYFERNPKSAPLQLTLGALFSFFSNLVICHWAKDKSLKGLANELNYKWSKPAEKYYVALNKYNAKKALECISLMREYDAKSKGFESPNIDDGKLLKELLVKIMN